MRACLLARSLAHAPVCAFCCEPSVCRLVPCWLQLVPRFHRPKPALHEKALLGITSLYAMRTRSFLRLL